MLLVNVGNFGPPPTIPEAIAVLLGIEDRTTVEWRVEGETRRVRVKVGKYGVVATQTIG